MKFDQLTDTVTSLTQKLTDLTKQNKDLKSQTGLLRKHFGLTKTDQAKQETHASEEIQQDAVYLTYCGLEGRTFDISVFLTERTRTLFQTYRPMVAVYTCLTTRLLQVDYGCSVYLSDEACVAGRLWF